MQRFQGALQISVECTRVPQFKIDLHASAHGRRSEQNDPLRLGLRSFGSKLMDRKGLKVSIFQLRNRHVKDTKNEK